MQIISVHLEHSIHICITNFQHWNNHYPFINVEGIWTMIFIHYISHYISFIIKLRLWFLKIIIKKRNKDDSVVWTFFFHMGFICISQLFGTLKHYKLNDFTITNNWTTFLENAKSISYVQKITSINFLNKCKLHAIPLKLDLFIDNIVDIRFYLSNLCFNWKILNRVT